jgi:hypothetical protein
VSLSFRKYIRIVLVVALAILVFRRMLFVSTSRLVLVAAGVLALVAVIWLMANTLRKSRKLREEVPKNPLGLD